MLGKFAVKLHSQFRNCLIPTASKPMTGRRPSGHLLIIALILLVGWATGLQATTITENPFVGITSIIRTETLPRAVSMHIIKVDLTAPGIGFKLTPPGVNLPPGTLTPTARETVRQTTLNYLNQQQAQIAVNSHFFLPFPSSETTANLVGFAASNGTVYSPFEAPTQSYAIVTNSPAINITQNNSASIVHKGSDGTHIDENVPVYNAFAGSAQIITNGVVTIPEYRDATHPNGLLTPNASYYNGKSWYDVANARTIMGLTQDNNTLVIFTVDKSGPSLGLKVGEAASLLLSDYGVYNAINCDGGGSTTLAMENPTTGLASIINVSADSLLGRAEGSNLAIFAAPVPLPPTALMLLSGLVAVAPMARRRMRKHRRNVN